LPKATATRLRKVIDDLAVDPRPYGHIKMKGFENQYRVREGDYRILYSIYDAKLLVLVIDVGPRKDIYR
jgi:mRNA interferase RelE/StbE